MNHPGYYIWKEDEKPAPLTLPVEGKDLLLNKNENLTVDNKIGELELVQKVQVLKEHSIYNQLGKWMLVSISFTLLLGVEAYFFPSLIPLLTFFLVISIICTAYFFHKDKRLPFPLVELQAMKQQALTTNYISEEDADLIDKYIHKVKFLKRMAQISA